MARRRALNPRPPGEPASTPAPGGSAAERQEAGARVPAVDALRGLAVLAMIAFHFCFDLAYFRFAGWDFYRDPFWLHARTAILSSFLLLAGASLVLAQRTQQGRDRFRRHVLQVAACALLVSVGSYLVFPRSYIWFGVLHAIAVSLLLIRPLAARPAIALALGIAVIAAGVVYTDPVFASRYWGWLGFAPGKPITEDYVPLFPWTGVMLLGIPLGHALVRNRFRAIAPLARLPRPVLWLGRHSLLVYLVHQPLLFGVLLLVARR